MGFFPYFCAVNNHNHQIMDIRALYQRFRAWQIEPYQFKRESEKSHQCFNCGNTFEGNYCPVCGQYYNEGPVNWTPEEEVHKPLWGLLEPGGLVSFIIQILFRPGYMISDYLKGRKQVTGSPMEVLYYFAAATLVVLSYTGNDGSNYVEYLSGISEGLGKILAWMLSHLDWAILIQAVLLILPVWVLFRFAPKHSHHTFKDGFFIQAFMTSIILVCIMLRAIFSNWLVLLVPICNCIAYHQLFGYRFWGTLWRTLLSMGSVFYIIGIIIMVWLYLIGRYPTAHSSGFIIAKTAILIVVGVGVVFLGYLIGKKTAHEQ